MQATYINYKIVLSVKVLSAQIEMRVLDAYFL